MSSGRYTIGAFPDWSAVKAVREARELRQRIDRGENPLEARKAEAAEHVKTVNAVLDDWLARHARARGKDGLERLRSADAVESALARLVRPRIGPIDIYKLSRRNVAEMTDHIQDVAGATMADRCRTYLATALRWFAERDDNFNLGHAIVRVQPPATDGARARVLDDFEIRAVWAAAGGAGTFGAMVKFPLLTAARRCEASDLPWTEIDGAGVWTIPALRSKNKKPHVLPLSRAALELLQARSKDSAFVFAGSGGLAFSTFTRGKALLDRMLGDAVQPWTLHDLRRTARTLLARAGISADIAERVLGHSLPGLEAVYNHHGYEAEKGAALEALAGLLDRIIKPPAANVVPLRAGEGA